MTPLSAEEIAGLRSTMDDAYRTDEHLCPKDLMGSAAEPGPIARLLDEVTRSRALLKRIEWDGCSEWYDSEEMLRADGGYCPECEEKKPGPHTTDCALAALLETP